MKSIIISFFLLMLTSSYGKALERFDLITTEQLHTLLRERSEKKSDFLLINTLDTLIYDHHSIPGSVNIPWSRVDELSSLLPKDKDRLIITYCMGYR